MNKNAFEGIQKLYSDKIDHIFNAHICIIGLGGVGSWCAEMLARSGVGQLTLVDMDDICFTNINRQSQAQNNNVGKLKTDELSKKCKLYNEDIKINGITDFYTPDSAQMILATQYDYIIDAFDSVKYKAHLIYNASLKNIPVITCGGAGGKKDPLQIKKMSIAKSYNDKLISAVRRELRSKYPEYKSHDNAFKLPCVFSPEPTNLLPGGTGKINCRGDLGSAGHLTSSFAMVMVAHVLDELCKK